MSMTVVVVLHTWYFCNFFPTFCNWRICCKMGSTIQSLM